MATVSILAKSLHLVSMGHVGLYLKMCYETKHFVLDHGYCDLTIQQVPVLKWTLILNIFYFHASSNINFSTVESCHPPIAY